MTRQAYLLPKHGLVVFWTQKAACTSIVHALCDEVIGLETVSRLPERGGRRHRLMSLALHSVERVLRVPASERRSTQKDRRRWLTAQGYYLRGVDAAQHAKDEGLTTLGLIREPYDRLISAFQNKFVFYRDEPLNRLDKLEWFARDLYLECQNDTGHTAQIGYHGLSFREFVTYVCNKIDDPGVSDTYINNHWNTQIPEEFWQADFRYTHLYSMSQSGAFFEKLSEITGTPLQTRARNRSKTRHGLSGPVQNLTDFSSLVLSDMGELNKASFEAPDLRARVRKSFAVDYNYLSLEIM